VAEHFGVGPDGRPAVSTWVGELGSRASGVMLAAPAQVAVKSRVWGGGVTGSGFADGPNGFVGQLTTVAGGVGANAALVNYDALRLRHPCGHFHAVRAGLALGYLIIGSQLVTSFSHGRCVLSMGGVDDDSDVVAAVTVMETN
jgi:hypothetical protein